MVIFEMITLIINNRQIQAGAEMPLLEAAGRQATIAIDNYLGGDGNIDKVPALPQEV